IATIQSLPKQIEQIQNQFGTILVDECHHIPAETFRNTIEQLNTFYLYGLTATAFRKYNDDKPIFTFLGGIVSEVTSTEIQNFKLAHIIIISTNVDIPLECKTDKYDIRSQSVVHDSERNKMIQNDMKAEISNGKRIAIITERKEHIDTLYRFLKQS